MKKQKKLVRRVCFLLAPDVFKKFSVKCATMGEKYTTRIRILIEKDLGL